MNATINSAPAGGNRRWVGWTGRTLLPAVMAGVLAVTLTASRGYADTAVYRQALKSTAWVVAKVDEELSRGSGVLVDKQRRLVVTNYHVVREAREALVFFPYFKDGAVETERDFYVRNAKKLGIKARVIAVDRRRDLALIELPAVSEQIPAIELAEDSAGPGETVHSLGNPGSSDVLWAYTSGTVRAVYRKQFRTGAGEHNFKVLETQSPINSGDSGGPVVNGEGKLVGVSQAMSTKARLVSYSVDVSEVKAFLDGDWKPAPRPAAEVLEAAELTYSKQENGVYTVAVDIDGGQQSVFAAGETEYFKKVEVRRVWSLAANLNTAPAADVLTKLLEQNARTKMGAWTIEQDEQGNFLVFFVAKVDATATPDALKSVLEYVARLTKSMKKELSPPAETKQTPKSDDDWFSSL